MFKEVHPRVSMLERIFLKEASRVGLMWQPQVIWPKEKYLWDDPVAQMWKQMSQRGMY